MSTCLCSSLPSTQSFKSLRQSQTDLSNMSLLVSLESLNSQSYLERYKSSLLATSKACIQTFSMKSRTPYSNSNSIRSPNRRVSLVKTQRRQRLVFYLDQAQLSLQYSTWTISKPFSLQLLPSSLYLNRHPSQIQSQVRWSQSTNHLEPVRLLKKEWWLAAGLRWLWCLWLAKSIDKHLKSQLA